MFTIHKKCSICGEIGHKRDMVHNYFGGYFKYEEYYHKKCYMETHHLSVCLCGKGFMKSGIANAEDKSASTK